MKHLKSLNKSTLFFLIIFIQFLCLPVSKAFPAEKPRIAIKTPKINKEISKHNLDHLNLSILLMEMEMSLRATRKFDLLTRQTALLKELRDEQKFSKSDLAKGNAAREGELENADYLVIPIVQDFKFYRTAKPVPNISNKYIITDNGFLQINAQVLDTSSGQIKSTFYLENSFSTEPKVVNTADGDPNTTHFTKMAKKVSAQMADQLIDAVFPMLILRVKENQVWINRGSDGGLKNGEILKVYKPGEELIDPYTNESLGSAEELIGQIKVTRINPKFTIAEIESIELKEPVQRGFVVRRIK